MYVEMFYDRKIRRLKVEEKWLWVCVLGAARESPEPGKLFIAPGIPMSEKELAELADIPLRQVRGGLTQMESLSMITQVSGVITVTNWSQRQFESDDVTKRTTAHRERSKEPDRNVPKNNVGTFVGTYQKTETETETETEEKTPPSPPSKSAPSEPLNKAADKSAESFENFWNTYPRRVSKGHARRAWVGAIKKTEPETIAAAAAKYAATMKGTEQKFIPHPATWLNGERWADQAVTAAPPRSLPTEVEQPPTVATDEEIQAWYAARRAASR